MGAGAIVGDVVATCGPLAIGAAVGSSCTKYGDRCGGRVCHCEEPRRCLQCTCARGCSNAASDLIIEGTLHFAEVPQGVVGLFSDNELVVGIRAHTLPFIQSVGRHVPTSALSLTRTHERSLWGREGQTVLFGEGLIFEKYVFGDLSLTLPSCSQGDDLVIALGTRTVFQIPFIGVTHAQLDFDILGTVRVPVRAVLQAPQPVEVCIPILPHGEGLPQVGCVSLTMGAGLVAWRACKASQEYEVSNIAASQEVDEIFGTCSTAATASESKCTHRNDILAQRNQMRLMPVWQLVNRT